MVILSPDLLQSGVLGVNTELSLSSTNTDVAYTMPARLQGITISVYMTSGSGQMEILATTNKSSTIAAGTAKWFSVLGQITGSKQFTMPARVTAIRFVWTSGTFDISFYAA